MEQSDTEQMEEMLDDFCNRLNEMVDEHKLEPAERGGVLRYTGAVLNKRAKNYKKVKKEAD